jgi:hypothetical protein
MDVVRTVNSNQKTGIILVFFYLMVLLSCSERQGAPEVLYENGRATAVRFTADKAPDAYRIYLSGESQTPVLGSISSEGSFITFKPAVPFGPGNSYNIREGDSNVGLFKILPGPSGASPPELLAIYPARDTVPENLLKCYLQFSRPMQAVGRALDYIRVTRATDGLEVSVFLDMPAELWNEDHSQLTLWLDPGRIKKGLIPNETLGKPLQEGNTYLISVSQAWRAADGTQLKKEYVKKYIIGPPDEAKPNPERWQLVLPKAGTADSLVIHFEKAVDAFIAREAMGVYHDDNGYVSGEWEANRASEALFFTPANGWAPGSYTLVVDARLEDLAGNNIRRLFDTDLANQAPADESLVEIKKHFILDY